MDLTLDLSGARDIGVALLAGLAVGIERERSGHATGPAARFAGARTFLLLGLLGGVAGWLSVHGAEMIGVVILAAGGGLTIAAYSAAARHGLQEVGGTTEVAALAVLALGAVGGAGAPLLTSAATSVMVLALAEKGRIHTSVERLGTAELTAALMFAVLALVVLPIVPPGPYGPFGAIRPRGLWLVVLLLSGINFAGYLAQRAVGSDRGFAFTGLLGGLISSTVVTLSFGARSRREEAAGPSLAWGTIAASAVVVPRVFTIALVLDRAVAVATLPYLVLPGVLSAGIIAWTLGPWHGRDEGEDRSPPARESPLRLGSAIRMALLFQVALLLVPAVEQLWGREALLSTALILGMTDVDAMLVAMVALGQRTGDPALAALGIMIGMVGSAFLKTGLAVLVGGRRFRWLAGGGLLILALVGALSLWIAAP